MEEAIVATTTRQVGAVMANAERQESSGGSIQQQQVVVDRDNIMCVLTVFVSFIIDRIKKKY
jgi:hypothetical protein